MIAVAILMLGVAITMLGLNYTRLELPIRLYLIAGGLLLAIPSLLHLGLKLARL